LPAGGNTGSGNREKRGGIMPENEKPELTDEAIEAEDVEVVAHSADEDEEDGALEDWCIINNSSAL
jgi:hypothetical protein